MANTMFRYVMPPEAPINFASTRTTKMTDASNAAAGAVLMQWQRRPQWTDKERELLWKPDDND
eukprot:662865-Pleurochrysis_carterae.AAC.1